MQAVHFTTRYITTYSSFAMLIFSKKGSILEKEICCFIALYCNINIQERNITEFQLFSSIFRCMHDISIMKYPSDWHLKTTKQYL